MLLAVAHEWDIRLVCVSEIWNASLAIYSFNHERRQIIPGFEWPSGNDG